MTSRPSLDETLAAMRCGAQSDEDLDLLEVVEHVIGAHEGSADDPDSRGFWGRCLACQHMWPCPMWEEIERLTLEWLIRKTNETVAHFRATWDDLVARRTAEAIPRPRHETPEQESA